MIVGDARGIFIPGLEDFPLGRRALRGLRLVHTHLKNEPLSQDDLTDLALLRLDIIAAIGVKDNLPEDIYVAHLMPQGSEKTMEVLSPINSYSFNLDFMSFIESLEEEMDRRRVFDQSEIRSPRRVARGDRGDRGGKDSREKAILISVSQKPKYEQEDSLEELKELAGSSDVLVLDTVIQRPKEINPKYLMGEGKFKGVIINALNKGATLLIFDQDLSPSQIKAIGELTELKVIDRSQVILDIFARRAHTRDGKVQVELAQLKYRLPRLTGKGTAMSRLMGGVGGRGPGEMKLEIDRRRVRERIILLGKELKSLSEARKQRKQRRVEKRIPIVSIVGYTNAGKSTLLNSLTRSAVFVEERMFATLDTASRRLRFPREREIIITDTVGFIRDLPKDLMSAFNSTLEELQDADLLLHLVDISNPRFEQQIESVENILKELSLSDKKRIIVFNKIDKLSGDEARLIALRYNAVSVSALAQSTFKPLLDVIEQNIWDEKLKEIKV